MAVALRDSGAVTQASGFSSVAPSTGSTVAIGDLMVLVVYDRDNAPDAALTPQATAGWTIVGRYGTAGTPGTFIVVTRTATAAGVQSCTFSYTQGTNCVFAANITTYSGAGLVNVSPGASSGGTITATATTGAVTPPTTMNNGGVLLLAFGHNSTSTVVTTAPAGFTARATSASSQPAYRTYDLTSTATSSAPSQSIVWTASAICTAGVQLAVAPANTPPTAPTVTAPAAGATFDASATITWTAGTDPDAQTLTYNIDYSSNNGSTWTSLATGVTGTSYAWNTSALPSSTTYLVRMQTVDSLGATSAYAQNPGAFTINHNQAPTAPTSLNPSGNVTVDRTVIQRLSWTFTDPNAGDTQSKFDLQYRQGTGSWTVVTQTTTSSFYDAPANTFPAGSIEWQVRDYDAQGLVSPYAASAFFTAASAPATPTITSPTSGGTISTATGAVSWSAPSQDSYQVRKVADNAGAADTTTVYYDSGEVISTTARNAPLTYPVNSRFEHLQVRVKVSGLWSSWADVRVFVSYTPPATPTATVTATSATASILIAWIDPTPTGSQPTVSSHDILRRVVGTTTVTRLAAAVGGASWTDYTPASGVAYEYTVTANGNNGTSTVSVWTA